MGTLYPRTPYLTGHIPSPRILHGEISKSPGSEMDLKEAIYALSSAVLYANDSHFVESLEEHTDLLRRGFSLIPLAPVWFNVGSLWASVGDYRRARDAYDLSLEEDHDFTISWFCKGICHFLLREYDEARKTFRKCSSTFKLFSSVKFFDDYSLDFILAKDDVVWNSDVAKRHLKSKHGLHESESEGLKLRRQRFDLFLGPHKDCFKPEQLSSKKRGTKLKETFASLAHSSTIRKGSSSKPRKYAYMGLSESPGDGTRLLLRIPLSGDASTATLDSKGPQSMANATEPPRKPLLLLPRKRAGVTSRGEETPEERTGMINSFPLPPTVVQSGSVDSSLEGAKSERHHGILQLPLSQAQLQQIGEQNIQAVAAELARTHSSGAGAFVRTRHSGREPPPLPRFVFSPSPPHFRPGQLPQAVESSANNFAGNDNENALVRQRDPDYYLLPRYYTGRQPTSSSATATNREEYQHNTQQTTDTTPFTSDPDNAEEEHEDPILATDTVTASAGTPESHETFYSVGNESNNEEEQNLSSSPSPYLNSVNLPTESSYNPALRRRIFERMLIFLPVTETGGAARSRRGRGDEDDYSEEGEVAGVGGDGDGGVENDEDRDRDEPDMVDQGAAEPSAESEPELPWNFRSNTT
ncbi:hypothetical protein AJ79_00888 [Helicocarpus griseus UAMH5409]|uniref:Uncharacterized protein n=1 Tax=Helicocarpus griseus UAMH5409 TaxID=1447875 RepID=A0A2B7YAX0_9EURO|nr:hypothetical protein AJ79_00888 [Helicocarpus griseus UAMH5409]